MAHVEVIDLPLPEVETSLEVRRLVDAREMQSWLDAGFTERFAVVGHHRGRTAGAILGGSREGTTCVTAFALDSMTDAPETTAFVLLNALARRLGPDGLRRCAFALRRKDHYVRQAMLLFRLREEPHTFPLQSMAPPNVLPEALVS